MTEAVCMTDADFAGEGALILTDSWSFNQLSWGQQIAQGNQTILKGCRPSNQCHTAVGHHRKKARALVFDYALGDELCHKNRCGVVTARVTPECRRPSSNPRF